MTKYDCHILKQEIVKDAFDPIIVKTMRNANIKDVFNYAKKLNRRYGRKSIRYHKLRYTVQVISKTD